MHVWPCLYRCTGYQTPAGRTQGFCVYHRSRLVKPFWRVCNKEALGRGIIGLLEVRLGH